MSNLTFDQKLELHDRYVLSDCRIDIYEAMDLFEFGLTKDQLERFYDEIKNIERTRRIDNEIRFYQFQQLIYYRDN